MTQTHCSLGKGRPLGQNVRVFASQVTPEAAAEWNSLQTHLNEVGVFLAGVTDPRTSRLLADELHKVNTQWADFVKRNKLVSVKRVFPRISS